MTDLSRRAFLTATAGSAAAGLALATPVAARAASVPLIREEARVVIVGSGFGGGVAALRLAQAGVPVTLLERGRRWPAGPDLDTFPTPAKLDKRALWYESNPEVLGHPVVFDPYPGLLETVAGDNLTPVCAAGLGGGSLVYQGMTLQPAEDVFHQVLPEELGYAQLDRVYYPRVARMLQVEVAPDELVNSRTYRPARVFARNATRAGYGVEKIPMPIDWSFALRELKGEMKPSYTNGDCALGVNNGGKHSVDVTYIAAAEATGRVKVQTLHQVTSVTRTAAGAWQVFVDRLDLNARVVEQKIIATPALILAAGSSNTTRLLLKAKVTGTVPDLPDGVGREWGSNGDRIYVWTSLADDFGAVQGGPVVYGSKDWSDPATANTVIQASLPPTGADLCSTMMVGFGVSTGRGSFGYDVETDRATLRWPKDADAAIWATIAGRAQRIAGPWASLTDTNGLVNSTWHGLGGANMGTVCDLDGRVQGQRGLYVLDGALIPGSTGACNPSMTIAAIAERALDRIVATDVNTLI